MGSARLRMRKASGVLEISLGDRKEKTELAIL